MTRVHTIIFYSQELKDTISIAIYLCEIKDGLWNQDTNEVLLNTRLYSEFLDCQTQAEQRKFFNGLKKVSAYN